ncbi:hypothetical protein [Pedosphaera parvula]|uniref:Uncharacterized protein n=1 Tax=Pedosphaera parvula (strain Ellin514) TaxID=320771 RepID=B9XM30_PEDPL|nr:hypothetical protein [Pedosphaera parvula]EEF59158.1 hypothetical protein Cflav_PD1650 [Pedosphaera parvula Ellin514]
MIDIATIRGRRKFLFLMWLAVMMLMGMVFQGQCRAEGAKLSEEDRKALEQVGNFHEVRAVTNLPPAIVALCVGEGGSLAERGGKWNATDLVTDESAPMHRLIWAMKGGNYYVVHFEAGGRGHNFHVLVAVMDKEDAKPRLAMDQVGFRKVKNYKAFVESLGQNELKEPPKSK